MEIVAKIQYWRIAPRKVRLVCDQVRGIQVQKAMESLMFGTQHACRGIAKLIKAAVASASGRKGIDVDALYVKRISVDQGPTLKRFMTRARGSASPIKKKTSHVTLVLDEKR